jgi:uncharacterized membrane protein YtjA (UPF0391 family)
LFGRTKNAPAASTPADTPLKDGGKGRPTPSRKEAEAAAKARAKTPRTRKEQAAAQRLRRSESSRKVREGMRTGDERYLLARDKGPVRHFIRDYVDARWSLVELMIPVLIVSMVLGYSGNASARAFSSSLLLTMFLVIILEMTILRFRLRSQLTRRFPNESLKGSTWYAVVRAMQLRFLRMPKPQVKRGQALPDTYR